MSEEGEEGPSRSLIVVDPDLEARNAAEDLEDDLGLQVIAMDSMEFDSEASEEVLEATAIIVAWDLEIRSGLDLLEEIRGHETLSNLPILISTDRPAPALVKCAMQNGADSVLLRPYDAEEVRTKLEAAEAARSAA